MSNPNIEAARADAVRAAFDLTALEAQIEAVYQRALTAPATADAVAGEAVLSRMAATTDRGELITLAVKTYAVAYGVPAVLAVLMMVEVLRVHAGALLFDANQIVAWGSAVALVFTNAALEIGIGHVERKAGYVAPPAFRASLGLLISWLRYFAGMKGWQPAPKSPAHREKFYARIVSTAIMVLALFGSMHEVVGNDSETWRESLERILTRSSFGELAGVISGLIFTLAAVVVVQGLTRYLVTQADRTEDHILSRRAAEQAERMRNADIATAAFIKTQTNQFKLQQRQAASGAGQTHQTQTLRLDAGLTQQTQQTQPAKLSPVMAQAVEWLVANPDAIRMPYREAYARYIASGGQGSDSTIRRAQPIALSRSNEAG